MKQCNHLFKAKLGKSDNQQVCTKFPEVFDEIEAKYLVL